MDPVEMERALVGYLAGQLAWTVDREIGRGGIAAGRIDTVGVEAGAADVSPGLSVARQATLTGAFRQRDDALAALAALTRLLPRYGATFGTVRFRMLVAEEGAAVRPVTAGAMTEWRFALRLKVAAVSAAVE